MICRLILITKIAYWVRSFSPTVFSWAYLGKSMVSLLYCIIFTEISTHNPRISRVFREQCSYFDVKVFLPIISFFLGFLSHLPLTQSSLTKSSPPVRHNKCMYHWVKMEKGLIDKKKHSRVVHLFTSWYPWKKKLENSESNRSATQG